MVFDEPDVQGPENTSQIPELNVISFDIETTPDGKTLLCLSLYGKIKQDKVKNQIPKGYTNDASGLNLTKVDSIIDVPNSKVEMIKQLKKIL